MKNYEDFFNEAQQYSEILKKYEENGEIFTDPNFLPTSSVKDSIFDFNEEKNAWNRIDEFYNTPLFRKEGIKEVAIQQGELDNSYLIASFARIAQQPDLVEHLFDIRTKSSKENENGEFIDSINLKCGAVIVYFYILGKRTPVLIDTLIPFNRETQTPRFSHPTNSTYSPWFCLVEKAYAKLHGSYSTIIHGKLSHVIYQLFNYYPVYKTIDSILQKHKIKLNANNKSNTGNQTNPGQTLNDNEYLFSLLMKWQHENAIICADISPNLLREGVTQEDITNNGLMIYQSYLILKVRKEEGKNFICLKSPLNDHEWTGDWSSSSELWTTELKRKLGFHRKSGTFWMSDNDFFHYFTSLDIAEPVNPEDHSKSFRAKLEPGENDGFDIESSSVHLENHQTFVFKLKGENVKTAENTVSDVKVHITVEKRTPVNDDEDDSQIQLLLAFSNDKKIESDKLLRYNRQTVETRSSFFKFTIHVKEGQPFVVIPHRSDKKDFSEDVFVSLYCTEDFDLFNADFPDQLFKENDKVGVMFINKSRRYQNISRKIVMKSIDGKEIPSFESNIKQIAYEDLKLVPSNETASGYFEYDLSDEEQQNETEIEQEPEIEPEPEIEQEPEPEPEPELEIETETEIKPEPEPEQEPEPEPEIETINDSKEMNKLQSDVLSLIEKEMLSFSHFTSEINTQQLDINQFNDSFEKINKISNDSDQNLEDKIQQFFKTVKSLVLSCMTTKLSQQLDYLEEYNRMTSNESINQSRNSSKASNDSKYDDFIQRLFNALNIDQNEAGFEAALHSISQLRNENEQLRKRCEELEKEIQKQPSELQKNSNELDEKEIKIDDAESKVIADRNINLDENENQEQKSASAEQENEEAMPLNIQPEEKEEKLDNNENQPEEETNEQEIQQQEEVPVNDNENNEQENENQLEEVPVNDNETNEQENENQPEENKEIKQEDEEQNENQLKETKDIMQEEQQQNENENQPEETKEVMQEEQLNENQLEEAKEQEIESHQEEEPLNNENENHQEVESVQQQQQQQENNDEQLNGQKEEENQPDESQKQNEQENMNQQEEKLNTDEHQENQTPDTKEQESTKEEAEQEQQVAQSRSIVLDEVHLTEEDGKIITNGDEMPWTLSPEAAEAILNKKEEEEIEVEFSNSSNDINQTPTKESNNDKDSPVPNKASEKSVPATQEETNENGNQFEPDQAKSSDLKDEKIENQFQPENENETKEDDDVKQKQEDQIKDQQNADEKQEDQIKDLQNTDEKQEAKIKDTEEKQEDQTNTQNQETKEKIDNQNNKQQEIKQNAANQAETNTRDKSENKPNEPNPKSQDQTLPSSKENSERKANEIQSKPTNKTEAKTKDNKRNEFKLTPLNLNELNNKDNSESSVKSRGETKSKPVNRTEPNRNQNQRNQLKKGSQSSDHNKTNSSIDDDIIRFEPFSSKKSKSSKDEIEIIVDEDGDPKYPPKKKSEWSFEENDRPMNLRPVFFSSSKQRKKKSSSQTSQSDNGSSHNQNGSNSSFNTNTSIINASFSNSSIPHEKLSEGSPKSSLYLSVIETSDGLKIQRPNQNREVNKQTNEQLNRQVNEPVDNQNPQLDEPEVKSDQNNEDEIIEDEKVSPIIWKVTPSDNPNQPFILSKEARKTPQQQQQQQNQNQSNQIMSQNPALSSSLLFDSPIKGQNQNASMNSPSAKTEVSSSIIFDSPKQQRRQQHQQKSTQTPQQNRNELSPIRPADSDQKLSRKLLDSPPKPQPQPQQPQPEPKQQQPVQKQHPTVISPTMMKSSDSGVRNRQISALQQPKLVDEEKPPKEDVKTVQPAKKETEKKPSKSTKESKQPNQTKTKPKPIPKAKVPPKKDDQQKEQDKKKDAENAKQKPKANLKSKPKSKSKPKRNENESEKEKENQVTKPPPQPQKVRSQSAQKATNDKNVDKNDQTRLNKNTDVTKTNDTSPLSFNTSPIKKPINNNNNKNDDYYRYNSNNDELNYKYKPTKKRPSNANPYYYNDEYEDNKIIGGKRNRHKVTVEVDFDDSSNDEVIPYEPKSKKYRNRQRKASHKRHYVNEYESDLDLLSPNNSEDDFDNKLAYENQYFNFRIGGNNSRYANPLPRRAEEDFNGGQNQRPRQATFMKTFHLQNVPLNCSYLPARLKKY